MSDELLDYLKKRYGYEAWRDSNTLDENLFIWRFFLSGNEFPGWCAQRLQPVETVDWPPFIKSIWNPSEGGEDVLLSVNVFECASRTASHELLAQLLGEFQSPSFTRQGQTAIGDVAFASPEDAGILFARANLVIWMRSVGRKLTPITEVARKFDGDLVSRPDIREAKVVPEIQRFYSPMMELQVGISAPLDIEASDPLDRPLWYKFFSRFGDVFLEEEHLVYRPMSAGPQEVTVFAINANRGATSQELTLTVK